MIKKIFNNSSYYTKIKLPSIYYEKYIVIWQPNHITQLHDHNGKSCKYTVLKGELNEILFDNYGNIINNKLINKFNSNEIIKKEYKHIMRNNNNKLSYTYHVYY